MKKTREKVLGVIICISLIFQIVFSVSNFDEVAQEGLNQIDEKGYPDRFNVSGKKTHKIALVFSSEGKGLLGWKCGEE